MPTLTRTQPRRRLLRRRPQRAPRGFTLLELLVVVAIIALGSGGVVLALRDSAQAQLEREGQRLVALLESARAQSRARGVPVRWHTTAEGFQFDGLAPDALPTHWLTQGVRADTEGAALQLGPEPIIGRQQILLSMAEQPGHSLRIATDGLRPFNVQAAEPTLAP